MLGSYAAHPFQYHYGWLRNWARPRATEWLRMLGGGWRLARRGE